ncbi:NAD-dependent epimerase/dehydratase (plasmid) [Sphingomonadaceae bacterium OTU29LAMAA1]|nr:NAD-dependent epimerase/dehydratase [Sphingomonadaceae bacterium OTU29LAMAA1]
MTGDLVVIGAGGRVGRLLRLAAEHVPPRTRRWWSGRGGNADTRPDGFRWSLDEGGDALAALTKRIDASPALLMLAGATTGSGADLAMNVTLATACLEAAAASGSRRVLLASSSAVYGDPGSAPITEMTAPRDPNPYGLAKLAMEAAALPWRDRGIEVCCLRIGNVLGADALMRAAATATLEAPLCLDRFADGDGPRRSYIGPATLLRVVEALATCPETLPPVLNIAAPVPIGMADLARAADIPWRWQPAPETARQDIVLSCTLLKCMFDFGPADHDPSEILGQLRTISEPAHAIF